MNAPATPSNEKRSVSFVLGLGIFFLPFIFSWFTLRRGYSVLSRALSIGWCAIVIIAVATGDDDRESRRAATPTTAGATAAVANLPAGNVAPAQPATPPVEMPKAQAEFCAAISSAAQSYQALSDAEANQLKLSAVRSNRASAVKKAVANGKAASWIGRIEKLSTTGEGKAHVSIEIPCDAKIQNWNNEVSDIGDGTLIKQSSPLYSVLADLGEGKSVKFSGAFIREPQDAFRETSMSEIGSMTDPEYLFRFTAIELMK